MCFIKNDKYFHKSFVHYNSINYLELADFFLTNFALKHDFKFVQYILFNTLE